MKRLFAAIGMLAALQAQAQTQTDAPRLVRVDAPAAFYSDKEGCPAAGETCRSGTEAAAGDELLITKVDGDWSYAWSKGWVRSAGLVDVAPAAQPAWAGVWKSGATPGSIEIAQQDDTWLVEALKDGAGMRGVLRVEGPAARYDDRNPLMPDFGCRADFLRVGAYLVVRDNGQCGDNTRFDGVYTLR
jgi:hypothetical protein